MTVKVSWRIVAEPAKKKYVVSRDRMVNLDPGIAGLFLRKRLQRKKVLLFPREVSSDGQDRLAIPFTLRVERRTTAAWRCDDGLR